jgi:hypothetical protein
MASACGTTIATHPTCVTHETDVRAAALSKETELRAVASQT